MHTLWGRDGFDQLTKSGPDTDLRSCPPTACQYSISAYRRLLKGQQVVQCTRTFTTLGNIQILVGSIG